jgi:phosphonoacetaldehyde hydrolase
MMKYGKSMKGNQVEAVIFDWAGTTVDYGCFAPLAVFLELFDKFGVPITVEEARKPMGLMKSDHIRVLCGMERIAVAWEARHGRQTGEADIDVLYGQFEKMLLSILPRYSSPIPGIAPMVDRLRRLGLKIGSTTGYTGEMAAIVAAGAKLQGYEPDCLVTADQVPAGRPYPFMCYLNAAKLGVGPLRSIVKVGDTQNDILEGVNADMWSIGVIQGGSELGLTETEVQAMDLQELSNRSQTVRASFLAAGAHYVIDRITELEPVLDRINIRLSAGEYPDSRKIGAA